VVRPQALRLGPGGAHGLALRCLRVAAVSGGPESVRGAKQVLCACAAHSRKMALLGSCFLVCPVSLARCGHSYSVPYTSRARSAVICVSPACFQVGHLTWHRVYEPVVQFRVIRETLHPPLGRSRGTLISRLAETKIESHVEFGGAIFSFELVYCIDFTVSRSGELLSDSSPGSNLPRSHAPLLAPLVAALSPLAGRKSHDSCQPACAGTKLNNHADHPQRASSSRADRGASRGPTRLVGPAHRSRCSAVPARRRAARDSILAKRRAWAAQLTSSLEFSGCARIVDGTFRFDFD